MWPHPVATLVISLIVVTSLLTMLFWMTWDLIQSVRERRAETRRQQAEADLNRRQAELRRTVLALADALAQERLAALATSEQMVARAYLTTGRVP